ncbi:MAG: hypothetical protein JSU01_03845 [Bacteroidetes bacterium]|nr:hypothetical protein [Bacteroidota bacterium]
MKTFLTTLLLLAAGSTISLAQCDKKVSLTSSKTQHLDEKGQLKHADDEKVVVEFNKTDISVSINNDGGERKLTGKVNSDTCNWKVPFKEGSSKLHVTLQNDNGESRDYTITVTGKDGKVTFMATSPDEPDEVIKLDIEKFEEKS